MRIRVLSDLHLEFHGTGWRRFVDRVLVGRGPDRGADVLVLAGDVTAWRGEDSPSLAEAMSYFCTRFGRVVVVLGNHEYYGTSPDETRCEMAKAVEACRGQLAWLDRSSVEIDGARFVGASLWFPRVPEAPAWTLNDFSSIRGFAPWVYQQNAEDRRYLEQTVRRGDVVVTHHLPCRRSIAARYAGSSLNAFFLGGARSPVRSRPGGLDPRAHPFIVRLPGRHDPGGLQPVRLPGARGQPGVRSAEDDRSGGRSRMNPIDFESTGMRWPTHPATGDRRLVRHRLGLARLGVSHPLLKARNQGNSSFAERRKRATARIASLLRESTPLHAPDAKAIRLDAR